MTVPGWTSDGTVHRHEGYRIEPAPGQAGGWILHVQEPPHPVLASIDDARFDSLKAAKAAAIHHRMMVTRRTKMIRHGILAIAGVLTMVVTFAFMGLGPSTSRGVGFVVGLVAVFLTLRELVGLIVLLTSHGWDYAYDKPKLSMLDRAIGDVATAIAAAPEIATENGDREPRVHVVDVDDAKGRGGDTTIGW